MDLKQLTTAMLRRSLPRTVRRSLVNLGFNLERSHFQDLATKHLFAPDMRAALEALSARGFSPKCILDVGAFEGTWSKMALRIWPDANLILLEANPEKAAVLGADPMLLH